MMQENQTKMYLFEMEDHILSRISSCSSKPILIKVQIDTKKKSMIHKVLQEILYASFQRNQMMLASNS